MHKQLNLEKTFNTKGTKDSKVGSFMVAPLSPLSDLPSTCVWGKCRVLCGEKDVRL